MRKLKSIILMMVLAFALASCYTLEHTVGSGAQGNSTTSQKQWYALWGLVPINSVDSKSMAGGAENYDIKSQHTFIDLVISAFTNIVTVNVKTVEVTK